MIVVRILAALLLALAPAAAAPAKDTILIRGARVFDGSGSSARVGDVLIEDDRIAATGSRVTPPVGTTIVEAKGLTLLPGLHDLHIHTGRRAFTTPEALTAAYAPYLLAGVTSVNEYSAWREALSAIRGLAAVASAPHLQLAIRMGVPYGHGTESSFTDTITAQVTNPEEARAAVALALPYKPDLIKVFADGWRYGRDGDRESMDEPTLAAIVAAAHAAKVPVVTHTVTLAGAKIAAKAGVDAVVHGIGDALVDAELIALMKRSGMAYVPTLVVYEPQQDRTFGPREWAALRPDERAKEEQRRAEPYVPVQPYDAKRWGIMQENIRRLHKAGVTIGVGTDAGIGGVYHGAATLREIGWLTRLGFSAREALRAATSVSAGIIHQDGGHGRIAKGMRADLTLTGGRPDARIDDLWDVRRVWVSGREMPLAALRSELQAGPAEPR